MKKTLLSAAILAASFSTAAYASQTGQAMTDNGGGGLAFVPDTIFDHEQAGALAEADSGIATVITTVSGLGGDGGGGEPSPVPNVQEVVDALPGGDDGSSGASSAKAGAVAVTVSGNVQQNLNCTIASSDAEFDFGDIDLADTSVTSGEVSFGVTCSNETTATTIYLTTGDADPAVAGGKDTLEAVFNDGLVATDVDLEVAQSAGGVAGAKIGKQDGDVTTLGTKAETAITLVATLDTTQITSGSGGTLNEKGSPEIAVWVN